MPNTPKSESAKKAALVASVGAISDKGKRSENQDRMSRFDAPLGELLIVADGVGGNVGGATASRVTVETIERALQQADGSAEPQQTLRAAIEQANTAVYGPAHSGDPNFHEMASTVVAVLVRGQTAHLAHVGDSRAYLLRGKLIRQLTRDHSRIQQMIDNHEIAPEQAKDHPEHNVITRAIGDRPEVRVESTPPLELEPGDALLLCSDGLHGSVPDEVMTSVVGAAASPQEAARNLVALALKNGSTDNTTVLYARFDAPQQEEAAVVKGGAESKGENQGGKVADKKVLERERKRQWPAAIAAAAIVAICGYLSYPLFHGSVSPEQEYATAVNDAATVQAEVDQADTVLQSARETRQELETVAAPVTTAQQSVAAATSALTGATQSFTEQSKQVDDLKAQIDTLSTKIKDLNAKLTRTEQEKQDLDDAKTQKGTLNEQLNTAKSAAQQADQQVRSRQAVLDQANQALSQALKLPSIGGQSADDLAGAIAKSRSDEKMASDTLTAATGKLQLKQRHRDALAVQLGKAPGDPSPATPVDVSILATDDGSARTLRAYFAAHPIAGASVRVLKGEAVDSGVAGSAATIFAPAQRTAKVDQVRALVEPALREAISQAGSPAPKLSAVLSNRK